MNKITLIGNLCSDPELRTTTSGIAVCSFRIAVNRRYKDANNETPTDFIFIQCWRKLAEVSGKYLSKGNKVAVVGSLQTSNYKDKEGNNRTSFNVVADEIDFLTPKGQGRSKESLEEDMFGDFAENQLPF